MLNLTEIAQRIQNPSLCVASDIPSLKALCESYPYAQIFPLLYLKTLAQTNDIRLDQELQFYAYRITDRAVLHDLLTSKPTSSQEENSFETVETAEFFPIKEDSSPVITEQAVEETIEKEVDIISAPTVEATEEQPVILPEIDLPQEAPSKPAENNITLENEENPVINPQQEVEKEEPIVEVQVATIVEEEKAQIEEPTRLPSLDDELLKSLAIPTAAESYSLEESVKNIQETKRVEEAPSKVSDKEAEKQRLIELLAAKKPLLEKKTAIEPTVVETNQNEQPIVATPDQPRSFTSWLRIGENKSNEADQNTVQKEEAVDVLVSEKKEDKESIIDRFISTEPKISSPKEKLFEDRKNSSELYNPTKKAKQSLDDTQLPVSETLAKIFAAQGNYPKAIFAYQQLMLIFPEKKVFFASQIEELNKKLNT